MIAMRHKKLVLGFSTIPMDYNGSCTTNSPLLVLYYRHFILVGNQFVLVAACINLHVLIYPIMRHYINYETSMK